VKKTALAVFFCALGKGFFLHMDKWEFSVVKMHDFLARFLFKIAKLKVGH